MDDVEFKGEANAAGGAVERTAGRVTGDAEMQGRGAARQVAGEVQADAGKAQAVVEDVADKVSDGIAKAGDKASAAVATVTEKASVAYDRAAESAQKAADVIEPFVQQRPYAALSIAVAVGVIVGLLVAGRGPKVVYIRPQHRT